MGLRKSGRVGCFDVLELEVSCGQKLMDRYSQCSKGKDPTNRDGTHDPADPFEGG